MDKINQDNGPSPSQMYFAHQRAGQGKKYVRLQDSKIVYLGISRNLCSNIV